MRERQPAEPHVCSRHPLDLMVLCPTFAFFNEEVIGGRVQGDAAGDSFANRSNRTSAAAISCLFLCGDDAASSVRGPSSLPHLVLLE
jgi:hypothetical protein